MQDIVVLYFIIISYYIAISYYIIYYFYYLAICFIIISLAVYLYFPPSLPPHPASVVVILLSVLAFPSPQFPHKERPALSRLAANGYVVVARPLSLCLSLRAYSPMARIFFTSVFCFMDTSSDNV